ncbi:rhomboid-like protein [Gordonia sp. CPCC 205515]|uniref:rhomboid-like protein n=1 Tax=Gordonia sp. CPCC 205515 TaxID=3140791 RepID=UPI003AF34C8A
MAVQTRRDRWRSGALSTGHLIRSAPLTFLWLAVLLVTTIIQRNLSTQDLDRLLGARSTNIHHLTTDPIQVLVTSLFWIDGAFWLPYLLMFLIFHVPAERWLGSWRWLVVGLSAHVIASYVSEGILALAIRDGVAKTDMVNTLDVGVSYFLAAIVGVLTYRIAYPWRWIYLAGIIIIYGAPLVVDINFTAVGHFTSLLIGLAWYPITRSRRVRPWSPHDVFDYWPLAKWSGTRVRQRNS